MKYIIILGDGMSDYPDENNATPLTLANKPTIDSICAKSKLGLCQTVPFGMKPGSDTANLSVMGYDPKIYYTGRSPLEAISMGIKLNDGDIAYRLNLVTLGNEQDFDKKTMQDYSAGEIPTNLAHKAIQLLQSNVPKDTELYAGVSYRHCLVRRSGKKGAVLTPPHDITGKIITDYLPKGEYEDELCNFMQESNKILSDNPKNPSKANSAWLWGEGEKPQLDDFCTKFGIKGAVISAVDLIKGIGIGANLTSIDVDGATGTLNTNYEGKAAAAINALKLHDFVYVHIEAPDECGHHGDKDGKIKSIENIDQKIVKPIYEHMCKHYDDFKLCIIPDHATPLSLKTHTSDPVPYLIYHHKAAKPNAFDTYNEFTAKKSNAPVIKGCELLPHMLKN